MCKDDLDTQWSRSTALTGLLSPHPCSVFATPWTVAHPAPLSMGFSRQEYWSGLPYPPPGDLSFSDPRGNWTAMLYLGPDECYLSVATTGPCQLPRLLLPQQGTVLSQRQVRSEPLIESDVMGEKHNSAERRERLSLILFSPLPYSPNQRPSMLSSTNGYCILSTSLHTPWEYVGLIPCNHVTWRRQWQPTPVLLPGKSHGWRSLLGCSPWGC